jgi:mono/diheme cytochrome c family protein
MTALLIAAASGPARAATPAQPNADAAMRGLYVALRVCAACHAVDTFGKGPDGEAPSFAVIRLRHNRASLRRRLQEIAAVGHQQMPAIPLTRSEIEDVASYIETVGAPPGAEPPSRSVVATPPPPGKGRLTKIKARPRGDGSPPHERAHDDPEP